MELLRVTGWEYCYGHLLMNNYDHATLQEAVKALRAVKSSHPLYLRDRARVTQEAEQQNLAQRLERKDAERRQSFAVKVPAEPSDGAAGTTKICFHLEDDQKVWRRFDSSVDTLQDLLNFVKSLKGTPTSPQLQNITISPVRVLDEKTQLGFSLYHLDLWPAGHVRVTCAA